MNAQILEQRRAGILLHITSLPSRNLGDDAYRFVDLLVEAGVSVWQMLPLGPTHADGSPYQCLSAHAGSYKLICTEKVRAQSWAQTDDLVADSRLTFLAKAYRQFTQRASAEQKAAFDAFCEAQKFWLGDYVLFCEIRHLNQSSAWFEWPEALRQRQPAALAKVAKEREEALAMRRFEQFLFFEQWLALKRYANDRGVYLFGDMPIFVAHDSADVWTSQHLFTLDASGHPELVAGVPPDYFSATGQRWGNPLYRWDIHQQEQFAWWKHRVRTQMLCFDLIRIDHFRGFEACWEIDAACDTAIDGCWRKAPGDALFQALEHTFTTLPFVAEDLGIITPEVVALRDRFALPGMNILQFAFGSGSENPYLPHSHHKHSVTYTGTHDNDTTLGWYNTLDAHAKQHLHHYLGHSSEPMPWLLNRVALQSVAQLAVLPFQDVLALDGQHRLNVPGTSVGNWQWRFDWDWLSAEAISQLRDLNQLYGRC